MHIIMMLLPILIIRPIHDSCDNWQKEFPLRSSSSTLFDLQDVAHSISLDLKLHIFLVY